MGTFQMQFFMHHNFVTRMYAGVTSPIQIYFLEHLQNKCNFNLYRSRPDGLLSTDNISFAVEIVHKLRPINRRFQG